MRENRMKRLSKLSYQRAIKLEKLNKAKIVKIVNKQEADAAMHPFFAIKKESLR